MPRASLAAGGGWYTGQKCAIVLHLMVIVIVIVIVYVLNLNNRQSIYSTLGCTLGVWKPSMVIYI